VKILFLRLGRHDELGLRRAFTGRAMAVVTALMVFLTALAMAGWVGAELLTRQWESGAGLTLTVLVPRGAEPDASGSGTRLSAVQTVLAATQGVESVRVLPDGQVNTLLRPWLGEDLGHLAVPVPAVIAVHLTGMAVDLTRLTAQLTDRAPGSAVEDHAAWAARLGTLARGVRLWTGLIVSIVSLVAAVVIVVVTRSGLAKQKEAMGVICQLGATGGFIARRFASRAAMLAAAGGVIGELLAVPVMLALAPMAESFAGGAADVLPFPSPLLWLLPLILPAVAAAIGFVTTQITVRRWLRRLP
jgi:cell division transport system permease protein